MRSISGILLLLISWTTLLSCNGVSAIINGKNISTGQEPHQFPYLVSFVNSTIDHWCGGLIVSDQYVLTAAHCVMKDNKTFYDIPRLIVSGVHQLNINENSKVVVEVEEIFVDERYDHFMWAYGVVPEYDWALLKLKAKLDIKNNPNLSIIELPKKIPGTDHYDTYLNVTASSQVSVTFD
ncbi:trypsin-1 [Nasonia vitripennis]|uniref:Peptidase S1 domain-containing protein n=1 Tax=Nasonia vitripennis TaxID=7425 RepID=A0A7M7INU7_NASVI|nr:trypsin-1 [Nasonia vitripennis]